MALICGLRSCTGGECWASIVMLQEAVACWSQGQQEASIEALF